MHPRRPLSQRLSSAIRSLRQGYALFHRGNAFRVRGRFRPEAEDDFDRANVLWKAGEVGDPDRLLDEARVLGMEASFKRTSERLNQPSAAADGPFP